MNKSYEYLADYYNITIVPGRVRKPKDKLNAESSVNQFTTYIIAKLRNRTFFSIEEYNNQKKLETFNNKKFRRKPGSRKSVFMTEDYEFLSPLPIEPYEYFDWKTAKVQSNSHIAFEKKYYSVPYKYIGKQVHLRVSRSKIQIYYQDLLICTHKHSYAHDGAYITDKDHMPNHSNARQKWDKSRFIEWADK